MKCDCKREGGGRAVTLRISLAMSNGTWRNTTSLKQEEKKKLDRKDEKLQHQPASHQPGATLNRRGLPEHFCP
jgi:hypothetical protein